MNKLERICVGTNFGPECDDAMAAAACLGRAAGASIDLVNVVRMPALYERALTPIQAGLVSKTELVQQATAQLDEAARSPALEGLKVRSRVRTGSPFAELLRGVEEYGDQLLVVGARPRGGLSHLFGGSAAERVLRKAPVPVLIAKASLSVIPRCILVPTDFSEASQPAAVQAARLARDTGARLVFLHVIEPAAQMYGWAVDLVGSEIYLVEPESLEPEWETFLGRLDLAGVELEHRTIKGLAAQAISNEASAADAELIVMGTHGHSGLAHVLLGSVAEGVARLAAYPLLTLRPDAVLFRLS